jgi:RNA polymerase sigma factor (sigma-70 family)
VTAVARIREACHVGVVDDIKLLVVKLRRLLRSRGRSVDDTDDLIQEAFLRLHLYCQEHAVRTPEAFLVRTALNLSADQYKRERQARMETGTLEKLTLVDPNPAPDVVYAGQKRLQHWMAGINALSPRQREVFLLNRAEGYSFPQIAERLGVTLSMVEKHAAKAVLFMTDWMEEG